MKSVNRAVAACLVVSMVSSQALAQAAVPAAAAPAQPMPAPAPAPAPMPVVAQAVPQPQGVRAMLPANTEVLLSMNEELTTKRNKEGDRFYLTVVHDVRLGDYVVIPKGARATGEITWKTGKGAFGKSGKMDISINYIEAGGQTIPVIGTFRQEGEGNTVATVAGVIAAGVFAAFITGKSGVIPRGRELTVHTKEDTPVLLAASAPPVGAIVAAPAAAAVVPVAAGAAPAMPAATAAPVAAPATAPAAPVVAEVPAAEMPAPAEPIAAPVGESPAAEPAPELPAEPAPTQQR